MVLGKYDIKTITVHVNIARQCCVYPLPTQPKPLVLTLHYITSHNVEGLFFVKKLVLFGKQRKNTAKRSVFWAKMVCFGSVFTPLLLDQLF